MCVIASELEQRVTPTARRPTLQLPVARLDRVARLSVILGRCLSNGSPRLAKTPIFAEDEEWRAS